MSEADGVDGGAICKRGFTHLQFAEKPEAPEAERHLGSWILEFRYIGAEFDVSSYDSIHIRLLDANTGRIGRTLASVSAGTDVVFSGANKSPTSPRYLVGPQMQQPPRGGTWVGSICNISKSVFDISTTGRIAAYLD
uniref:Uncharacterized protein n=1 Tax=Vespula pensylvanica TaxID=30213 RepID=A0A834N4Z7_VESPE|nr:hypothetical protein H0235_016542 [Vespula pensylvanica]